VLVIAEPGGTAEGDKATMLRLLETAHACGANVWKPQWTSDPMQMCERRHIGPDHPKRAYYEAAYRWLQWPVEWHAEFRDKCHALGMQYACSVYLPQDVATVAPLVDYLKISSFEAGDAEIANSVRGHESKAIVSTGMGNDDLAEWWQLFRSGTRVLHCVSAYPAPLGEMNLSVLWAREDIYDYCESCVDGLSDHSRHLLTGAVAVGAGAKIIEAHYRLDTCHPSNPDYAVAFTPAEFTQYIQNIRDAETMMGTGEKRIQECEKAMLPFRVTA
jgi:N,N'-diacetyllegionaminate synthase